MDGAPVPVAASSPPSGAAAVEPDYAALYHQAPCGYLTTDERGTILQVNDTFLSWTGHRREDLLGTRLPKLLPIGDQILWSTHCLPQLAVVGVVAEMAVEVVGADRTRRSALISAARVTGPAGTEDRVVVFSAHERLAYERNLVEALRRADASEARQAEVEADLRHLTHHDALTGLPNRVQMDEVLRSATAAPGSVVALLLVDLDHFSAVTDSLGAAAADELLVLVAQRLRSETAAGDTVARVTGDEFAVVAAVPDVAAAELLARRLLDAVRAPALLDGLEIVTTATVGLAVAADGSSEPLLRRAGRAVRRGKARGGDRCEREDGGTEGDAVERLRTIGELRRGIDDGQLRLHHQPRVVLATGALAGVEALVRWQHPTRGLLPPGAFVDVAEASGLVVGLGAWVLDAAVHQAATWRREGPPVEVAVNLSARQLADPALTDLVGATLARHRLPAHLLTLEITETAILADVDTAAASLAALRALGIAVAVDDFGTGYSSLSRLKRFPIDELKIDRSFVSGLGVDDGDTAIVASCVTLAHSLGIRAVAEGVETEAQRQALVDLGCDLAQGYLFARPLPAPELEAWRRGRSAASGSGGSRR